MAELAEDGNADHTRDVLDGAVRCLAVSPLSMRERLSAAGRTLLGGVSREDFSEREDRDLFDQIEGQLGDAEAAGTREPEAVAEDILDLRDALMGRAIRGAREAH